MAEKRNVILSLMISGALAGLGAAMLYLTGYEQWQCSTSSVPAMGFNGIAAAFLGGLNPHRDDAGFLLHPAHHRRRRVCG